MTMIPLSEAECTALIEKSGPPSGQYVPLTLCQPGAVALDDTDPGAAWAIATIMEMRAAQRVLAGDLNRAVEIAVNDTVNDVLNSDPVFEPLGTQDAVSRATDALTGPVTTAVFEALQASGFTILRKEG